MKLKAKELAAVLQGIGDNVERQRMRVMMGRKSRYCMVKCCATGDGVGVVSEKVSGARFNTFQPLATTKDGRTKEARAAVERRLRQYGCETVTKLLQKAALTPIN